MSSRRILRRVSLALLQAAVVASSLTLAALLRFEFSIPANLRTALSSLILIAVPVKIAVFLLSGLNRPIWRFAAAGDMARLPIASLAASGALAAAILFGLRAPGWWAVWGIDLILCSLLLAGVQLAPAILSESKSRGREGRQSKGILIYGAGVAGTMLVREIRNTPSLGYKVVGFLDDDLSKRDATLLGIPVLGTGRDAARLVQEHGGSKIQEIVIAIPSANALQLQEIIDACHAAGVPCKTMPGHSELLTSAARGAQARLLPADHLLGREPVQLGEDEIRAHVAGKAVLVTGAAGSIGSELCRQIAHYNPAKLIALDQAESDLFRIENELRKNFPALNLLPEIADIRDARRVSELMARQGVESVFHAAAYKHVPMMELHVLEAVKNNILGTWNLVQAAYRNHVSDFLLISTDKAVRPSSVMGATKRIAELITSARFTDSGSESTRCVSVRFGNVLGSNGSVVPLFQAQIAAGGPVTVTHPEVRRFFMTAREAVQLILQASSMGKRSEIFVLEMGEPVRIADLARRMIQLSGFVPGRDIEIQFTGLRPGEKIYEELITEGENILPTYHDKIKIFGGEPLNMRTLDPWIKRLRLLLDRADEAGVLAHIQKLVPEYRRSQESREPNRPEKVMAERAA